MTAGLRTWTRHALPLALLVPTVGVSEIAAQDEAGLQAPENANVFLEKTYLSPFTPTGKSLILEGHAAMHYWIRNSLTDTEWRRVGGWKRFNWPFSAIIVPRISNDFSNPVRTPSFILRPLYFQAFRLWRSRTRPGGERFRLFGVGVGGAHYSNGQSGCTFEGETYDRERDDCLITYSTVYAEKRPNLVDGSFSTNFFQLDASFRWGQLDGAAVLRRQFTVRLKGEYHPLEFLKGGLAQSLAEEWGQKLTGAGISFEKRCDSGTLLVDLWGQRRFGGVKSGYAAQLEVAWLLHRAENFGFFGRVHWGSDYYNIHYGNTDTFFQLGLMWDPGRLDRFTTRPEFDP